MFNTYALFLFSAVLVIISGMKLSKYGDVIANNTSLGHGIVGGVLIAAATSLPELVTSVSASLMGAPDIAIGNVYGSNIFNLMILAVADILHGQGRFLQTVKMNHILAGLFGVLLSALGALSILINQIGGLDLEIGWVSINSLIIFITYSLGSILIIRYENKLSRMTPPKEIEEVAEVQDTSIKHAIIGFGLAAAIIIWAGMTLAQAGDQIAMVTGLGHTFVGTLLIAGTTSLPELVATIAAIKIGAHDMAVGNVFGSNIFNMIIITVADLAYSPGSIFSDINIDHTITAMAGIVLSAIALIGLFYRTQRTILNIGWDSVFILVVYLTTVYLILIT
ncbi:sodium/calcium exchanger membrane region [Alkaliphilus metalliredigens QYMF]|uniref:Sodium/calcium exchanger membrane region n=1 Tax=Alkaliphilus metalliredigens (strain QYMF) TaxID=293826 RepID=A6TJL1_ALKMQ|nr:sodium:calcium antiporter [Alkaliphilus metalliredigens]ABR46379.1 sodium/calcium exchanger membrane region [Alkaliphilus metalliredigens QYMF]